MAAASGAPAPARAGGRRWVKYFLIAAAALALIGYLAYRGSKAGFEWATFAGTFRGVRWGWLAASCCVCLLTYAGRALRWRVMIRPLKSAPSFWGILDSTCIGFTAVVLFGRAGELVRPYLIATRERVSFASQIAAWFLERVLDLLMVALIFGTALAQISHSGARIGPRMRWIVETGGYVIGSAGIGCIVVILLFRYMSDSMNRRLVDAIRFLPQGIQKKVEAVLASFIEGMGSTRSTGFVVQLLAYSVVEWTLITISFVTLFRAVPPTRVLTLTDVVIFLGVVALGSVIQIPAVGGGMQVASILVLTEFFRMSLEVSTGIALVVWAISFLLVVPVGLGLALKEGVNLRKLTRLSENNAI